MSIIIANAIAVTVAATAAGSATLASSSSSASIIMSVTSSMTSSSASLRRTAVRGITDTAKRRASALSGGGCNTNKMRNCSKLNTNLRHGWNNGLAFSSLQLKPSSPLQYPSCAFLLPSSSSPRRFSNKHGNVEDVNVKLPSWSAITEIVHNDHPYSLSSTSLQMTPNYGTEGFREKPTRQPEQQPQQQQQQQSQQQQQQQPPRIPFPKLTPGRQRNYRPPHVISLMQQSGNLGMNTKMTNDAEKDFCDALDNSADREHCIENFRDGRESAKYLSVKGPQPSQIIEEQLPLQMEMGAVVNGDVRVDAPMPKVVQPNADIEGDDDDNEPSSQSEHFRNGPQKVSTRSGSDVLDEESLAEGDESSAPPLSSTQQPSLESESDNDDDDATSNPVKVNTFYENLGPSSMNFRDGTRMTMYKDNAFKVPVSERESAYEDLFGEDRGEDEDAVFEKYNGDNDQDVSDVEMDIDLDSLLNERTIEDEAARMSTVKEIMSDKLEETSSKIRIEPLTRTKSSIPVEDETTSAAGHLSIDPKSIDIIPLRNAKAERDGAIDDMNIDDLKKSILQQQQSNGDNDITDAPPPLASSPGSFVDMFRGSASYIANHRGTLAVYHIPGELLAWEGFPGLMDDIALTWLLGMKIVLVAGCRHQIDLRLEEINEEMDQYDNDDDDGDEENHLGGRVMMSSIRVTDEDTLRVVKEEAGFVRFEIERRLAKSLRLHGGLVKGSESLVGNVVSGNFYSAQPFGVVDGIDYCWTGFPRKVEIDRIRQVHETNDIVLLTSLGVSPSGEIFNVNSEFLAANVAGAMSASKIIYFNVHGTSFQNKHTEKPVQNLRVSDAKNLLAHYKMKIHPKGFALVDLDESEDGDSPQQLVLRTPGSMETLIKVGYSMVALEKGVKRAHILAPENGALVQELYTRDGCGTLISRDIYEGIQRADVNDVSGIYDLIDPLVRSGTLVERPKSTLEKEITSYYVYTRDGLILATGQLKRYEGGYAEIGCLVVSSTYRRVGKGDAMLGYLERLSVQCGAKKVFVLSTQTMEWFVERGFKEVPVESLPPSRQAVYNKKRKSKIYMKEIDGDRDLDAAELWWSNK
eukprot:CAMPEP_0172304588 /NCGR_PEP_ID=MMETSP1058-20130122/5986_1 /TAXON_ID=83371 /ORGANISM="Detonula confervacea, Strain CCMP 353" /LENGTH=1086 /DNA_ID=CAMNT_0013015885 /DNA_START=73 /DNA_END=3333 /DNA_ORIENTATION=+